MGAVESGPVTAASMVAGPSARLAAYIAAAKEVAADGLTWGEFGCLLTSLITLMAEALEFSASMTNEQKRSSVLDAAGMLFDAIAWNAVPATAWPVWYFVRPAIRAFVVALAGGILEVVLPLSREAK